MLLLTVLLVSVPNLAWAAEPLAGLAGILNRQTMDAVKATVAVAGLVVLAFGYFLRRSRRPDAHRRLREEALLWLGLFAGVCWWDVLQFHFRPYLGGA